VEVAYTLFFSAKSQPESSFMENLYSDWRKWAVLFGIPASMVPPDRAAFRVYMDDTLTELQGNLHPLSQEVVDKLEELSGAWTNLPMLAWPFAPLLLMYSGFNMAALDTTLPSLSRSYGREPEKPGMILSATKTMWSNMPSWSRYALLDVQRRLMLPLGSKFRKTLHAHTAGTSGVDTPRSRL
jgi:hypothetical protein